MNPNSYLRSFWRAEVTDTVFVAMSFEKRFDARFEEVIKPAIEDKPLGGLRLKANRVDNSRTGDSILTEIVDGIAHARVILADVSVVDEGRLTEVSVRNGNVMYEVGIALASRTPAEVLLVRDDDKKLLFDTSSIPHHRIPFENASAAIQELRSALEDRLREADLLRDARVRQMARSLTEAEFRLLQDLSKLAPNEASEVGTWVGNGRVMNLNVDRGVARLLDKGCIASSSFDEDGMAYYRLTPFGRLVVQATKRHVDSPEAVADGNSSPIVQESNTHPDGPN